MQDALTSPYGAGPEDLPSQGSPESQFIQQLGQVRIPQAEGAPSRVPQNEAPAIMPPQSPDAGLQKIDPMEAEFDAAFAQEDNMTAPTVGKPSFSEMSAELGPLEATKRSIGDSLSRAKLSFAQTDWEKQETLSRMYGKENVRVKEGELQFRRPGDKAFRALDPQQIEYIDDALDFARTATEVGAEGAIRGGITAAGTALGGPAGGITAAATSGGLSAAGALTVGDFIAQGLLGIPRDPQRSAGKELATAGTVGAVFGSAGKAFTQWRAAKEAAKGSMISSKKALETAQELEQISDNLAANGINLKQGKITLSPGQQASRYIPEAEALDTHLGTEGPVRNFFSEQGKLFIRGWDDLVQGISNTTGKHVDELFGKVKEASKVNTQLEGKYIEGFRDEALKNSKGTLHTIAQTKTTLDDIMFGPRGLGFKKGPPKNERLIGFVQPKTPTDIVTHSPSLEQMQRNFPGATDMSLGEYSNILKGIEKDIVKGKGNLNLAKMNQHYTRLRSFIDRNIDTTSNRKLGHNAVELKDQLQKEWTTAIGKELEVTRPDAIPQYLQSMSKYSEMKTAQTTLRNILGKNDLSAAAFADQLFSPAQGKDRVRQVKLLLNEHSPELWDKLRGTYLDTLTEKSSSFVKGEGAQLERVIDWQKMGKQIDSLDRAEILGQMFDERSTFSKENLKSFLTLAGRLDKNVRVDANALDSAANVGLMRRLITVAMPGTSSTAKIANLSTLIGGMGKDKAVAQWLDGKGLELVLKGLPKSKQAEARSLFSQVIDQTLRAGKAAMPPLRTGLRQSFERGMSLDETPLGPMSFPPEGEGM